MRTLSITATVLLFGCASVSPLPPQPASVTIPHPVLPTGASIIGTSTFATVLDAPPDLAAIAAQRAERERTQPYNYYGKDQGLSPNEGAQAQAEQGRLALDFGTLRNRLPQLEPGNYVDSMLRHEPSWAYVFFFRRDAERTLRRYTKEPKFKAEVARFDSKDREWLIAPWTARWRAEGLPFSYGLDAVYPTMDVQLGISEVDYRSLAKARGWRNPPEPIRLKFTASAVRPAVDPRIAYLIRGFANEDRASLMQMEALGIGTLRLRDGCLMIAQEGQPEMVAVFHYETGIGPDSVGYLTLIDRMTGKPSARVGETMAWGRPNAIPEKGMAGLAALRAACPGELLNIGNPESLAAFRARHPAVDRSIAPPAPPPPQPQRN